MSNEAHTYEAMFLLDPAQASNDWNATSGEIQKILKKHKTNLVSLDKWGERQLTYKIRRQARGVYALAYFTGTPESAAAVKADCGLSEPILRVLILKHEGEITKREAPKDFERKEGEPEPASFGGGPHRHFERRY